MFEMCCLELLGILIAMMSGFSASMLSLQRISGVGNLVYYFKTRLVKLGSTSGL
jgi:hypothetical protein